MSTETLAREHIGPHAPGTYAGYRIDGCRCYPCSAARSAYDDRRTRAIIAGTWAPFADAEPVRAHLEMLGARGVGLRQVAEAVGAQRKNLALILHASGRRPRRTRVRTELADAILAVRPSLDMVADHTPVDGTGTRRRLRALVAVGYPASYLANRLGITSSSNLHLGASVKYTAAKARAVRALYAELADRDPADAGISAHSISRSRNYAAARNWPRPIEWDDDTIDDSAARSSGGRAWRRELLRGAAA